MTIADGHPTLKTDEDGASDWNAQRFLVMQLLGEVRTAMPVKVLKCTNSGDVAPVGFVDVQPLVNQVDGDGNATPHAPITGLPYFRLQGGSTAVIIDPLPGDIGVAVFCDRDISSVKATRTQANPGSWRSHDLSDGWFFGGGLNATPTQYLRGLPDGAGMELVSPTKILLKAPEVEIDAETSLTVTSPTSEFSGDVTVRGILTYLAGMVAGGASAAARAITGAINLIGQFSVNGVRVDDTHTHSTPSGQSGPPTP